MIEPALIAAVKAKASLAELAAPVKKHGRVLVRVCPFHADKAPSLYIYPDEHFWCFGCNAYGDAIGWVMRSLGLRYPEAVMYLAQKYGLGALTAADRRRAFVVEARQQAKQRQEAAQATALVAYRNRYPDDDVTPDWAILQNAGL